MAVVPDDVHDKCTALLAKVEAERDALRKALARIANDGCGFSAPDVRPCYESERGEDDWCWCCIARAALKGGR